MKKLKLTIILMMSTALLTGCWDKKIYNEIDFALSVGIESSENGELMVSYTYPVISSSAEAVDIIVTKTSLVRESREEGRRVSPNIIEGGKVQQVLISDELAAKGIHDLLEIYQREPTNPAIAYIAICEGSPSELYKAGIEFKDKPRIAFYLHQLIDHNVEMSSVPDTKIFDFDINYFAPGLDSIAPMLRLGKDEIIITGCALFSDDKMTGSLNSQETSILLAMMGQMKSTEYIFKGINTNENTNGQKKGIAMHLEKPKRKLEITFDEYKPILNIKLQFNGSLDEYTWNNTDEPQVKKDLEKKMAKILTHNCNNVIKKIQAAKCDSIGIGNEIRARFSEYWFSLEDWYEIYSEMEINVDAAINITSHGIIN